MRKIIILCTILVLVLSGCFPAQRPVQVYHNVYIQPRSLGADASREKREVIKRNKHGYLSVEEQEKAQ